MRYQKNGKIKHVDPEITKYTPDGHTVWYTKEWENFHEDGRFYKGMKEVASLTFYKPDDKKGWREVTKPIPYTLYMYVYNNMLGKKLAPGAGDDRWFEVAEFFINASEEEMDRLKIQWRMEHGNQSER